MSSGAALERQLELLARPVARSHAEEAEVVQVVRGYLAAVREELERLHRRQPSGRIVNERHSDLVDRLVRRLFELAEAEYFARGAGERDAFAVLAVGGYARREMTIHSDVDLLLLHEGALSPYVAHVAERLQYWLWDAGVTVGCATRSLEETLELIHGDETVFTAVLDTRFLAGQPALFQTFSDAIRRVLREDAEAFIGRRIEALRARHARYGDSLYLLEPNVKEGAGGLRDWHAALWATRAVQPGLRGLDDLLHLGLLTESEMEGYRTALDFLWRVRNELHLVSKRRNDQMSFELQERIAEAFGYAARAGEEVALPVERFMGDYYRHARAVRHQSELVIEQCLARARPTPERPPRIEPLEDGFRLVDDHVEIPHAAHLRQRPTRLLSAFWVAQQRDAELSRTARRLVRENLDLVDDALRRDPQAAACFFRILDGEFRVMRTLMQINEIGLLGRFLPEWEHIVCRWQHVIYHTYTVDVHSIFLVEQLRRLWKGEYEKALPDLTELVRSLESRVVLFLGCLLHDVGKGLGGQHSRKGAERARACVERLGLDPESTERVVFLVRHHLLMSHVAQRRDLSDPKAILDFAGTVGDRTNLRNLYLLTFADIRASSASGWTPWKAELLRELFERAAEILEVGTADPSRALEQIERRVEARQEAARAELRSLGVAEAKVDVYFAEMPRRYFVSHTPRQIARHARAMLGFKPERSVSTSVREMRGDFSELIVCSRDVHGLYSRVAGTLTARGINILASHAYTTRSGLALEVYRVATLRGDESERRRQWEVFETTLRDVLDGRRSVEELLRRQRRPVGAARTPSRRPPSVAISNTESDFYTIVDVSANDRLGLLYELTRAMTVQDLEIYISKAATVMDQVADTFYVKDRNGRQLLDPVRLEALRAALLEAARDERGGGDG